MHARSLQGFAASVALLAAAVFAPAAKAQNASDTWSVQLTPYVWAAGVGGKLRPLTLSPTVHFSNSLGDVLDDLSAAAFVSGTARRDRFVLLGDISYVDLSRSVQPLRGLVIDGKVRLTTATLEAGYKVIDEPGLGVDLLGGLRAWDIRVALKAPGVGLGTSPSVSFADPVVAIRLNKALAPRWSAIFYADIGGGGGSSSTGQVIATVNYSIGDNFYVSAGYRYLSLDYHEKGTLIDIGMHGPLLGLTWVF